MARYQDVESSESSPLLPVHEFVPRSIRRSNCCCCTLLSLAALLAILLSGLAIVCTSTPQRPVSRDFPPDGPGIGLTLSTDDGSVSMRDENGNIHNIAHVSASHAYVDLLQRLSLPSSRHPAPPYFSLSESISDRPRQWLRRFRKRFGYPASSDVGILAAMLREMVETAQANLPSSSPAITSALAIIPNAMALYAEDVQDALEHIGLRELSGHNVYHVPRALPAAFAGYGLGLCADPKNFEECVKEEQTFQHRGVVMVDAGAGRLATDSRGMDTPMYVYNDKYALLDWHAWGREGNGTTEQHRDRIASEITHAIYGLKQRSLVPAGEGFVDEVLMAGAQGEDEVLKDIIRQEVVKYQNEEAIIRCEDPQWVVARGAAELAKRILIQRGRIR